MLGSQILTLKHARRTPELSWFETVYDSANVSNFHLELSDKSVSTEVPKNNEYS